jgi:hypothetical protein
MDVWDLMPGFMKVYAFIAFLIYVAGIIAVFAVVIAIWRGMKAHEKLADSMKRMADAAERRNRQV